MARSNYTLCDGDQHPLAANIPQSHVLSASSRDPVPDYFLRVLQSSPARNLRVIIGDSGEIFHSSPDHLAPDEASLLHTLHAVPSTVFKFQKFNVFISKDIVVVSPCLTMRGSGDGWRGGGGRNATQC